MSKLMRTEHDADRFSAFHHSATLHYTTLHYISLYLFLSHADERAHTRSGLTYGYKGLLLLYIVEPWRYDLQLSKNMEEDRQASNIRVAYLPCSR